jgi:hypothetical protein
MDNVTYFTNSESVDYAIIAHADGSFTSMLKSDYDAQQAQANPAPTAQ